MFSFRERETDRERYIQTDREILNVIFFVFESAYREIERQRERKGETERERDTGRGRKRQR